MERIFSPKRLQKEGKTEEAFAYYQIRYQECLVSRDQFSSSLYLDEIAQTLIIDNERKIAKQTLSYEQLREGLVKAAMLETLDEDFREQANLDIEVTLRKRYPGMFKETEPDEEDHRG